MESAIALAKAVVMLVQLVISTMTTMQTIFGENAGATKKETTLAVAKEFAGEELYNKVEPWLNTLIDMKKAIWKLFGKVPASDPIVIQPLPSDIVVPAEPA